MSQRLTGMLAGTSAAAIWGGMYVVSKVVLDVIPPFTLLVLRLVLGACALGLLVRLSGSPRPARKDLLLALLAGLVGFGLSLGLQFVGTQLSTASNAALVTSASPAFMVLFAIPILGERASPRQVAALVLASVGMVAVIDPRTVRLTLNLLWGNLALLGAALTWGLYSVLARQLSRRISLVPLSLICFLGGLILAMPAAVIELRANPLGTLTGWHWLGVLYLGLVSTALAMYLWNKSLALLEAGVVSLLFFAQPVVGVGLGAMLLREHLGAAFWLGAFLISSGLILVARRPAVDRPASSSEPRLSETGREGR